MARGAHDLRRALDVNANWTRMRNRAIVYARVCVAFGAPAQNPTSRLVPAATTSLAITSSVCLVLFQCAQLGTLAQLEPPPRPAPRAK